MLDRGERLSVLVEKADNLQARAGGFVSGWGFGGERRARGAAHAGKPAALAPLSPAEPRAPPPPQADSLAFRGAARRVRRVMWWDSVRLWLAFGGGAAAIIGLLVLASCGIKFERC